MSTMGQTQKPFDTLGNKPEDCQRGFSEKILRQRFPWTERFFHSDGTGKREIDCKKVALLPEPAKCPECGARMGFDWYVWKDKNTGEETKNYYPQCVDSNDPNHGFSGRSIHGVRAKQGRSFGWRKNGNSVPPPNPPPQEQKKEEPKEPKKAPGEHEKLQEMIALYNAGERNFLLEGPAGCGKTMLAIEFAKKVFEGRIAMVQGSQNIEEGHLSTSLHPITRETVISPFAKAMLADLAHVCLVDEIDGIIPGVTLSLNATLANKVIAVDGVLKPIHKDTVVIATCNASHGANRTYTGRFPIDGAVKDRFYAIQVDYSETIDRIVCPDENVYRVVKKIRTNVNTQGRKDIVGVRFLARVLVTTKAFGMTPEIAARKVLSGMISKAEEINQVMGSY